MDQPIEISVVSAVYRADYLIEELVSELITVLDQLTPNYEILLVEDCSPDNSWEMIQKQCALNDKVKAIRFSRNFGQQQAIQAGLEHSQGNYVINLDCDLQDPPSEIINLYNKALEGYDIVVASREDRKDDVFKKFYSWIFYKVLGYLTETTQDSTIGNFFIANRKAIDALLQIRDTKKYYPMLLQWIGFKRFKLPIKHSSRPDGHSSYTLGKRIQLAYETILNFSDKPLRLSVKFGMLMSIFSIIIAIVMVIIYFSSEIYVPGWSSLAILFTFLSGVIISVLGTVGLYVGRTFESVKDRPRYIVDKTINYRL